MVWVKQWDFCVFGKKKGKKRPRDDDENFNPDDEYHRPREKVLYLPLVLDFLSSKFTVPSFSYYQGHPDWGKRQWRML
jgi:hypothetical protein